MNTATIIILLQALELAAIIGLMTGGGGRPKGGAPEREPKPDPLEKRFLESLQGILDYSPETARSRGERG